MKRTPLKRSVKRINPISKTKKRRRLQAQGESMKALREPLYMRAGMRCERCWRMVTFDDYEMHHRKLRSRGGLDELANLVALCHECHHNYVHAFPHLAKRQGYMVSAHEDPKDVPVRFYEGWFDLMADGRKRRSHLLEGMSDE